MRSFVPRFDSKLVRLKVYLHCDPTASHYLSFDSKLVRLKVNLISAEITLYRCFDSKLVRLKEKGDAIPSVLQAEVSIPNWFD